MGNTKKVGDTWATCNALVFSPCSVVLRAGSTSIWHKSKKPIDHNLQQKQQYFSIWDLRQ
jgi:hypothetical protein